MTDRLTTAELDELERLHRESKRGAWYRTCTGELPLTHGAAMAVEDACLIAAALNALPRLIAAAREEERLRAALRLALEAMSEMDFALDTCGAHQRTRERGAAARLCARAALAGKDGE